MKKLEETANRGFFTHFFDLKQRQVNTVAMITFWSQFAVYTLNTILVLYLTRPLWQDGLGLSEAEAYAFMGVSQAMNYLVPMLGGFMADNIVGVRRSILIGSLLLALAYALVMLSGFFVAEVGAALFIGAYALIPAMNSLLMGTASALVSRIYSDDEARAKGGMTLYYMSINIGALLATIIAPQLLDSKYGPLSIFAVVFIGKALSALNFSWRYRLYNNVIDTLDKNKMKLQQTAKLVGYLTVIYLVTLFAYFNPTVSSYIIGIGCGGGITWFLWVTLRLSGEVRTKQVFAVLLIVEAIVFFVLYNQMNSTLVVFAAHNSDLHMFGLKVAAANFQVVNPVAIIIMGLLLPKFYRRFPGFNIPYQFAAGVMLAGAALLVMWYGCAHAHQSIVSGNYLVLAYFLMTVAELFVSAIGLSMIGLYCDMRMISFAMGAWYLACAMSNVISGQLAQLVALPAEKATALGGIGLYTQYYLAMGGITLLIGFVMFVVAIMIKKYMENRRIKVV
ncbi:IraAB [Piscirickettsia salmonis]|nr:IraAB [Piscirickettsia salmonis]